MKYENFDKAKEVIVSIDKTKVLISELNCKNVSVKLLDGNYGIMAIDALSGSKNPCSALADKFVSDLKSHFERRLKSLHAELETL